MPDALTREALIAAATELHDAEGCSCDRKYLMSCHRMANAILRSGPAATTAATMPDATAPEALAAEWDAEATALLGELPMSGADSRAAGHANGLLVAAREARERLAPAWDALTSERNAARDGRDIALAEVARLRGLVAEILDWWWVPGSDMDGKVAEWREQAGLGAS